MAVPGIGIDGKRLTVNSGISPLQRLWNVRAGLNVAALNCRDPRHAGLVENYGAFLNNHKRELSDTNTRLGREYRAQHGSGYRNVQDAYMTKVYNYFALPPALSAFCDEALMLSGEAAATPRGALGGFSDIALPRMEAVFENFFRSYEQYRVDVAAWDAKYGPSAGAGAGAGVDSASTFGPVGGTSPAPTPIETVGVAPSATQPDPMQPMDGQVVATPVGPPAPQSASGPVFVSNPVVQTPDNDGGQ
jgi:hypothetical protein